MVKSYKTDKRFANKQARWFQNIKERERIDQHLTELAEIE